MADGTFALSAIQAASHRPTLDGGAYPISGCLSGCVLCRTELHEQTLVRSLPGRLHAGLLRFPLAYGFVVETHSLLHRMVLRWRLRYGAFFLPVSLQELRERLQPGTRTHAYMQDMQSFVARCPWATIPDLETYRDAWQAG